ncbi:Protein BIM1 [Wickerhamiella sorbophila]|uniref:Protein BIM1 n=1 Tax=Wickerhamiella sorbophila TaxID=45607 RepID=A0A2T0FMX8_9ASCO|nr:Protein BIM1 [Wickerhamiella sorbophila]PRT56319.1 Protein BIM1 [Wickerhamiella sorbophila]
MSEVPTLSRQGLVKWVNETLQLNISKLDELGTGAAYCQFMDLVFGDIPLAKVKFNARNEYEFLHNYKILQACFTKHRIEHPFDAPRLARCRLQDNLEFTQWIYKFVSTQGTLPEYEPEARRKTPGPQGVPMTPLSTNRAGSRAGSRTSLVGNGRALSAASRRQTRSVSNSSNGSRQSDSVASRQGSASRQSSSRFSTAPTVARDQKLNEYSAQLEEYSHNLDVAITERTLYYGKLLEIEDLIQNELERIYKEDQNAGMTDSPHMLLLRNIQSVLYARAEGFETPYRPEDEPF